MPDKFTAFDPTNPEFGSLTTNEVKSLASVEFDTIRLCNKFVRPIVNVASVVACVALGLWLVAYTEFGQHHNYIMSGIVTVLFLFIIRPFLLWVIISLTEVGAETKSHEATTIKHRLLMHDRAGRAFVQKMIDATRAKQEASTGRVFQVFNRTYNAGEMFATIYRDPTGRVGVRLVTTVIPGSLCCASFKGRDVYDPESKKGAKIAGLLYRKAAETGLDMSAVPLDDLINGDAKSVVILWNPIFALQLSGQPYKTGDIVSVGSLTISDDKQSLFFVHLNRNRDIIGTHLSINDFTVLSERRLDDLHVPEESEW